LAKVSQRDTAAIVALTALALLLRVTSLSRGLFTDEAYSLALAQRGFGHMFTLFGFEPNGTPYSIVLWPLIRAFGTGAVVLRLPAVLAGTASVPALWWTSRRFATGGIPLLAAALLAINPMAVWYSQEARPYAFVVLAGCLAFGALGCAVETGERRAWVGYVAAMALLAYSDLLAAPIVLPAQALIAWRGGRESARRWLWSLPALLACCLPLLVGAAISRSRRNALYWLPKPGRGLVELALQEFAGGLSGVSAVRWATVAAGATLVAAAAWRMRHRHIASPASAMCRTRHTDIASPTSELGTFLIAACWGVIPCVLLFVVSFIEPVFYPRYAIVGLPGLCLLVALAAGCMWDRRRDAVPAVGCLMIVVVAAVYADTRQWSVLQEDWPPIAAWLRVDRAAGQPTVVDSAIVLPSLGYYDPAFRAHNGELVVREWHDNALPAGVFGFKDPTGYGDVPDGPPSVATFTRLARSDGGSVWMIVSEVDDKLQSDPRSSAAVTWARRHCRVQVRESTGVWAMHASGCSSTDAG
jgi:4-amino-4-deoxy-L-arabinose transferase-like glycosyltransferase